MKNHENYWPIAGNVLVSTSLATMLAVPIAYEIKGHMPHYRDCGFQRVVLVCKDIPPQDVLVDTASKNTSLATTSIVTPN